MQNKLFQATMISSNSCYVHTVLIVAESKETAHNLLCEQQKRQVKYTQPIKELIIDMKNPNVIEYVGFGCSDDNNNFDD